MMQLYFVWLGSKRAQKNGVGEKGVWLDLALRSGLPVPNGGILLDAFYQLCLAEGVAVGQQEQVMVPNPAELAELLFTAVRFPRLAQPVAVRSAVAGAVLPQLNVQAQEPLALATALSACWSGMAGRRDLLLMEMAAGEREGTAVLRGSEQIVYEPDHEPLVLPMRSRWQQADPALPPHLRRLQKLLAGVRRTFGRTFGEQVGEVTWLDDGAVCWLLQLATAGTA